MLSTTPDLGYLALVTGNGLLRQGGPGRYVVGTTTDAVTKQTSCLVEYADPVLLVGDGIGWLSRQLHADFPDVDALVVRTDASVVLPSPWSPYMTYVRWTGPAVGEVGQDVAVRPVDDGALHLVRGWLVEAVREGARLRGCAAEEHHADALVGDVLARPHRRSFLATVDGRPIGHATMLTEAFDDVTATRYVDLFDTLVAAPEYRRAAVARLVAECVRVAGELGLPLLGNVVHERPGLGYDGTGARIRDSLLQRGWTVNHQFWWAPGDGARDVR
jgi:hypothetical protein